MSESTVVLNVTDPGNNLHGVPPCPGCGDRHRYPTWHAELERELTDVPPTWIPALLRTLIRTAMRKQVFLPDGGLETFVHSSCQDRTPSDG